MEKRDLINREVLKEVMFEEFGYQTSNLYDLLLTIINNIPEVELIDLTLILNQEKEPQGTWISGQTNSINENYLKCSICNYCDYTNQKSNFCPNCGIKMRRI